MIYLLLILIAVISWAVYHHLTTSEFEKRVEKIRNNISRPDDVQVIVENGCFVSHEELKAIRDGLIATFNKAKCLGWTYYISESDLRKYTVAVIKADEIREGIPVFRLKNDDYKGSEFDAGDGYIYAAGLCLDSSKRFIVIPEHRGDVERLKTVVSYEAEHIAAFFNDFDLYNRTKVHGENNGHPFLPQCG